MVLKILTFIFSFILLLLAFIGLVTVVFLIGVLREDRERERNNNLTE